MEPHRRLYFFFCPPTTKPFTVACSAKRTVAHFLSCQNTEGANVISMRLSHHQRHEIPTCHDHPNLAMLYSECQLTPAVLLRGFLFVYGVRARVRAAMEYPRITCDNHGSMRQLTDWFVNCVHFRSRKFLLIVILRTTLDRTAKR
jgi:hypothetical protein